MSADPRTGRHRGGHGTAMEAIEFGLEQGEEVGAFLRAWREGRAADEWPEFYVWLGERKGKRS